MATKLTKPVKRETDTYKRDAGRIRPMIVVLQPFGVEVGLKGMRTRHLIPYVALFDLGARLKAMQARKEKADSKKAGGGK